MDGSLIAFGHWLQNRPFALAIAGSDWAYPFVQATHFTGLSLWVGTNVAVDLSLLGAGKKSAASLQLSVTLARISVNVESSMIIILISRLSSKMDLCETC